MSSRSKSLIDIAYAVRYAPFRMQALKTGCDRARDLRALAFARLGANGVYAQPFVGANSERAAERSRLGVRFLRP